MKALHGLIISGVGVLGLLATGCGDDSRCDEGETIRNGVCTAGGGCGEGTTFDEATNECVPDGSTVCAQGTVFDTESGTCVVDPDACADGTVFVEGACIPEDENLEAMADFVEGPENNDGSVGVAGMVPAPAVGESVSLFGCVEPADLDGDASPDADIDAWVITTTEPTVLDITADGIRGLTAGYIMVSADPAHGDALISWQRNGFNLTGDTSQRQLYLPLPGAYALFMSDSRTFLQNNTPAGAADACYFTSITASALPAPTAALSAPVTTFNHSREVLTFTHDASAEAEILASFVNGGGAQATAAFVTLRNGEFFAASDGAGALVVAGNLQTAGDTLTLIFDPIQNFALTPQTFQFEPFFIPAFPLPTDGSSITITKRIGDLGIPAAEADYLFFDVAEGGQIVSFDLGTTTEVGLLLFRENVFDRTSGAGLILAELGTDVTVFNGEFVRFLDAGRYYLQSFDADGISGETYDLTSTLAPMVPSEVTYGDTLAGEALPAQGAGFHTVALDDPTWSSFNVSSADFGATAAEISAFDPAGEGLMFDNYLPVAVNIVPSDGSAAAGAILYNSGLDDLILAVRPDGTPDTLPATYDVTMADRVFVDLGAIDAANPIARADDPTVGGVPVRYFVTTEFGDRVDVAATPTDDVALTRLGRVEQTLGLSNGAGGGATAVLSQFTQVAPEDFIAFTLATAADDTVDLNVSATAFTYDVAAGALVYADVCADAEAVQLFNDDDEVLTPPAAFPFALSLFNEAVANFSVSSNGFVAFGVTDGADFTPDSIPNTNEPNGYIAPMWVDLDEVIGCMLAEANQVTFQWEGTLFLDAAETVQFQLIIHDDGVLDLVYGDEHLVSGDERSTTVGAENLAGLLGNEIFRNEAGINPGDSYVLTPRF